MDENLWLSIWWTMAVVDDNNPLRLSTDVRPILRVAALARSALKLEVRAS